MCSEQKVPDECKRLAANRPGGWQNYVFTPHADDLAMSNPDRTAQVRCAPPQAKYHQAPAAASHTSAIYREITAELSFTRGWRLQGPGIGPKSHLMPFMQVLIEPFRAHLGSHMLNSWITVVVAVHWGADPHWVGH